MKILITGAGGFVGQYLIERLLEDFPAAKIFAATQQLTLEADYGSRVSRLRFDITDAKATEQVLSEIQPSHVIHMAAISHVPTAIANPELAWKVNVFGTLYLLETIKRLNLNTVFINIGSSEVYGESFKYQQMVSENTLLAPLNPYAASKAAADLLVGQYAQTGIKVIRLRPFNHIGPGQREDFVVPALAKQIARIEAGLQPKVIKVGNLEAARDFLDVRDVVQAYSKLLKLSDKIVTGSIINICSGQARKISEVLQALLSLSSIKIELEADPSRMRPADIPQACGNNKLAQELLEWRPSIGWQESLQAILDYQRKQVALSNHP